MLSQPDIRDRLVPLSILRPARKAIDDTRNDAQNRESDADRVACHILWCIFLEESKDGDDTADVAETNLPCRSDRAAMVASEIHVEPADDNGHGGICAHGDEEESRCRESLAI